MPYWNSKQLLELWNYAVERDFTSPAVDTKPAQPTTLALRTFPPNEKGDAENYHPFDTERIPDRTWFSCAISHDGALVAVARKTEIHLYNLREDANHPPRVLRGHLADVDTIRFNPVDSTKLVSGAYGYASSGKAAKKGEEEIILWDLRKLDAKPIPDAILDETAIEVTSFLMKHLKEKNLSLTLKEDEKTEVQTTLSTLFKRYDTSRSVSDDSRIRGRLFASFGNTVLDASGSKLFYLPGSRPSSNGDDRWDISILDLTSRPYKTELTLVGHRDAIMWAGHSPDRTIIGTACWDGTFRLWSAETGEERYVFRTGKQNWTGVFSPDSTQFLGTDGEGLVRVWSTRNGELLWKYRFGGWCRYVDWSSDGRWVAVGGDNAAKIVIFDTDNLHLHLHPETGQEADAVAKVARPAYERVLGVSQSPEEVCRILQHSLSVTSLHFLPPSAGGAKLGYTSTFDHAIEIFDIETRSKWRFARPEGVKDEFKPAWRWVENTNQLVIVSGDGIRVWKLDW